MSDPALSDRRIRLGVDIGGTFTDAVAVDEDGRVNAYKVPTTPGALGTGFLSAVDQAVADCCRSALDVRSIAHATTAATNAIIEGTGARVALVVTAGFRDVLEIGRQIRPDLFDLLRDKPPPLVPRDRVFEVDERMGPNGEVLRGCDVTRLDGVVDGIRTSQADAAVICLLHSYVNPEHENQVAAYLRARLPEVDVSTSSEVWPEFREYFRACTAVVNAMIRPIMRTYLREVRQQLEQRAIHRPLWVMQSSGGVLSAQTAEDLPVQLVESGPAAGLMYAANLGTSLGCANLVSFEVGGTTAKAGLVVNGVPAMTTEFEVGAMATAAGGRGKGSGYPIKTPVLDLVEIGAGGGSLAWVDAGGALRVGPRSAGADPGPACYERGGDQPTLTDANLVLGRIDPDRFLGGAMALSTESAAEAIDRHCATPLGLTVPEVAQGIVDIATANMARALRLVTVERGHDPAEFVLLAFGGAGPLHAAALASEVGFGAVVVPQFPGVLSAAGLLVAPVQVVETQTSLTPLEAVNGQRMADAFRPLANRAASAVTAQGLKPDEVKVLGALDLRYHGQSYELTIPLDTLDGTTAVSDIARTFHRAHERAYGHSAAEEPVEIVNWRVTATQREPSRLHLPPLAARSEPVPERAWLHNSMGAVVLDRDELLAGDTVNGPAVIAEAHSTTFLPHGHHLEVDGSGNLWISRRQTVPGS